MILLGFHGVGWRYGVVLRAKPAKQHRIQPLPRHIQKTHDSFTLHFFGSVVMIKLKMQNPTKPRFRRL